MTDEKQTQPAQAVKSYVGGIQARTAARQEARRQNPVLPNLAQAAMTYRASGGPQTLEQMAESQRADEGAGEPSERASLSPQTVEGLRALRAAQEAAQAGKAPPEAPTPPQQQAAPPSAPPAPPGAGRDPEPDLDPEDAAFANALREAREDVIQNERERDAVAKRVQEIDLAEGLLSGEFTQLVPVVPDKLNVRFRCLTPGENNELRLFLLDEIEKDPRKAQLGQDLLAFYQTVATIVSLNKTQYAKHMVAEHPSGRLKFSREIFEQKVQTFMNFPMPLTAALNTHSAWFEMRVRELFATTDRLKNG
jgi:hypothetical protein